ncbi:MAG: class I adenylate-forming enzyme family protein [Pseudomonadota bacterium]
MSQAATPSPATTAKSAASPEAAAAAMKLLMQDPRFKVGEAEIRGNTYRVFENAPASVAGLFGLAAATHGDKDCLIYGEERYSFKDMWSRACRLAHAFSDELGVRPGDRVAIAMRNYPEWCLSYMALTALGAVIVPLNAWWKGDELKYALEDSGAKTVICDARRLSYVAPFKDALGLTLILAREDGDGADHRLDALLEKSETDTPPEPGTQPDDDFCIVYTSGSTGSPKGVVLTHRGCVNAIMSWSFVGAVLKELDGKSPFGENAGILLGVPLFHVTGSHSIFMLSFLVGRRIAMVYKWDPNEAVEIINREKLTNFVGVPSQSFELIDAAGEGGMPSLLDIGSGGAKRPADHVRKLKKAFQHANPSSGYGLSETNAMGCVISRHDYQERPDSTGRPVPPLTDIRIADDNGEALPAGEVGEIWIRSPANFRCYLNKPDATNEALTDDGWFKTGDLGKTDSDGFVYIVDRIKDLIIRGGENISCLEVEAAVYAQEGVAEACVFSVPDDVLGERVGLVVLPKNGVTLDPAELRAQLSGVLAGFKNPERIWISPGPLPRLGTAKIDKISVRKMALLHPPALSA